MSHLKDSTKYILITRQKNGLDGVNREYIYYEFDELLNLKSEKETDKMPSSNTDSTLKLDAKKYE